MTPTRSFALGQTLRYLGTGELGQIVKDYTGGWWEWVSRSHPKGLTLHATELALPEEAPVELDLI